MSILTELRERIRAIAQRDQMERELEEELRFHLEHATVEQRRAGSADPERDARIALGGLEQIKEQVRDARGVRPLDDLAADVRFAVRTLRRNPAFTLTVVFVLGLAVAAATLVFVTAHRVLLAPFPFRDPEQLVRVDMHWGDGAWGTISVVDIQAIAEQSRSFEAFGAVRYTAMSLSGTVLPERIDVVRAQAGYFRALDVRPHLGRLIEPADELPGAPPVIVLSHGQAERAFGAAERALNQTVLLDGESYTVVGVLQPNARFFAARTANWAPLKLPTPERRGPFGYRAFARLKPGVTLEQAQRELDALSVRLFPIWQAGFQDSAARLTPMPVNQALLSHARAPVGLLAGAVALVLLAAVANVATLMLVRASAREHELAVRAALGAGRGRLSRLVVTECLVLTIFVTLVATATAMFGIRFVPDLVPNLPRIADVRMNGTALSFALILSLICGLLVSLAPLSRVAATGAAALARLAGSGSSARAGTGPRAVALRSGLVAAEFAVAFPLLVGAGLLFSSFLRLTRLKLDYDPNSVYALDITLSGPRYESDSVRLAFWRQLETRATEQSGVVSAGLVGSVPPDNFGNVNNFNLVDKPVQAGAPEPMTPWMPVTNGFFAALDVTLLEGRLFTPVDTADGAPVVIVSRSWANKYFPGESAVGKQLRTGGCTDCPVSTVVGVVGDIQFRGLRGEADAMYVPLAQAPGNDLHLVARSEVGAATTFRALRSALAAVDPYVAPVEVSIAQRVHEDLGDPRRWTILVGSFASAGVLLAALGIFGLMSYVVRQRQRELGVRLALGATPGSLVQLVVQRGIRYASIGVVIGFVFAVIQSRWLEAMLFGVRAVEPSMLLIGAISMLVVAVLACLLPGLYAARIRPVEALSST